MIGRPPCAHHVEVGEALSVRASERVEVVAPLAPARSRDERVRAMFDAHYDFIWRTLRRFGVDAGRVDDAAQQVFMIAAQKLDLVAEGSERSFLFGTAMRVASDVRRSAPVRREVASDAADYEVSTSPLPDELVDQRRARELLDRVLDSMDDDLRAVLVMFELEGMVTPEIAELLGIPVGTAASRLRRAREDFQAKVDRLAARGRRSEP